MDIHIHYINNNALFTASNFKIEKIYVTAPM